MTAVEIEQAKHCAPWSRAVLDEIEQVLAQRRVWEGSRGLDPFAGSGLDRLAACDDRIEWTGVEIEPEWACADERIVVGDATRLDELFEARTFTIAATSCTYGNRMADTYDGAGTCRACDGTGNVEPPIETHDCERCDGTGRDKSKRVTYRLALGRMPTPGSTAVMQWGGPYRQMHRLAWRQLHRVMRRDGLVLVNVSDHVRKGRVMEVADWHRDALIATGLRLVDDRRIATPRMRFGANHEARVDHERLLVLRKP